ncbi:MAG: DUF72 domain-containing protein [Acidobacteria bacterium]|nr:DUF72 domain-containing protein [Acidobacteriota bacterium]
MDLRIGTSGWHYPEGRGTWDGIFYPRPEDRQRGFDELAFYADRFNTVEVNSTFYGQPRPAVSLAWVRRTPPDFEFSVKLFQKFTHPATATDASPLAQADVDAFKAGIEPLAAAGRLGALLAQFPTRFHDTPEAREYLAWLLRTFGAYPLAVELRHRSWSDASQETGQLLAAVDAAWVQIDEPKFGSSIRQDLAPNSPRLMYVRMHGRNAARWWAHEQAEDRYNYLYGEKELAPIVEKLRAARGQVRKLYLYMNNHFAAQAVADATMVRHLIGEPVTARMPGELVARYAMLEGKVATLPPARLL